ncbi:hypothetical protein SDC9_156117 [bioreactor metagenome]|uniref:Uncharacterized protein n=1 Tax=bioreactor metagenome TaxID=1076179 RepID=A0A645F3J9_9ZZZZ
MPVSARRAQQRDGSGGKSRCDIGFVAEFSDCKVGFHGLLRQAAGKRVVVAFIWRVGDHQPLPVRAERADLRTVYPFPLCHIVRPRAHHPKTETAHLFRQKTLPVELPALVLIAH